MTRWTVVVSDETDQLLRGFLAKRGAKKGALSTFVDEAVRNEVTRREVPQRRHRPPSLTSFAGVFKSKVAAGTKAEERATARAERLRHYRPSDD